MPITISKFRHVISKFFKNIFSALANNSIVTTISLIIILLVLISAIFAPLIAPYDPNKQDIINSLAGSSPGHLLGTDREGRDILSRIIFGARMTLIGSSMIVLISTFIGTLLGLIAGYAGGKIDSLITRAFDIILSIPSILLAFNIVVIFGKGEVNSIIALSIVYIPMMGRIVRSLTLVEKEKTYIEAARSVGFSNSKILFEHILVNCISPIIVQITINLGYAILDLAGLSYLGLGVQPPTADWGQMLQEGRENLMLVPNESIYSGLAVMFTVIAFNILGNKLQQKIDPEQK